MPGHKGNFGSATPELRDLVKAACDGALTSEQRDRLESILRDDEAARWFYLAHMDMQARIQWAYRGGSDEDAGNDGDPQNRSRDRRTPIPGFLGSVLEQTYKWFKPPSTLLLATVLLLFSVGLIAIVGWNSLRHRTSPVTAQPVKRMFVAHLGRIVDARWASPLPELAPARFLPGTELALKRGLAEIEFASGAAILIEGPVRLRIDSEKDVFLFSGKATANVPAKATGFTVHTQKAEVVDLGTAFGVCVDEQGATEIQVFKGKVNAATLNWLSQSPQLFELTEGEGLTIGEKNRPIVEWSADLTAFPRLPAPSPAQRYRRWQAYRDKLRRDPSLVGYWSFDDDNAADISANKNNGQLVGILNFSTDVPSMIGGGKCLDVSGGPGYVLVPYAASLRVTDELTVAFWMRGTNQQQDWARIISNAGPMNCSGWVVHRVADLNQIRAVVGTSGRCNQAIADIKQVYDGRWHHIVITANRGDWCAYLDGELQSRGKYDHREGLASTADLVIGAAGLDKSFGELDFEGQIDELAIFRRAISPTEVLRMYSGGDVRLHSVFTEIGADSLRQEIPQGFPRY